MLNNLKKSGFNFEEQDANWEFKFKVLNSIMLIAMVFSLLFALLNDLGINDIGNIQSKIDYFYSLSCLTLLIILRRSRQYFTVIASIFLVISFFTFFCALLFVLNDEFRIIWLYVLIYITYILLGSKPGIAITIVTLFSVIIANSLTDLQMSENATYTAIVGLLITSLLSHVYTRQIVLYEKKLETKNNELEEKIDELDIALGQSQQASKAKSLFLASMSHEIRTPMNGVLGMVQVLRGTSLDEAQQHYIETLDSSSKSLLVLIDDLLDLSKIESGKLILDIEPFETFHWITDIQNITEPLFENKKTIFVTDISNNLPAYLEGDAARLLQIIINLVSNAAKSTPNGEVKLTIGGELITKDQFNMHISIKDTGIGIANDKLKLIFDAFHQLQSDRTANKGVGLGLAICKRLADIMLGSLKVTSKQGYGSCFTFDITLPVPDNNQLPVDNKNDLVFKRELSILLVDDDSINRLAARTLLEQAGQQVTEAENGQIAIDKISDQFFDVILMDVHMPVMGGITATQIIRNEHKNYKQVPIIGLTASVMSDEKDFYIRAGMNAVVEKPILIDNLMKTIQAFL